MKAVLQFWLDRGVSGFRMDAVPFLFEDPEMRDEPQSGKTEDPEDYNFLNHTFTWNSPQVGMMNKNWYKILQAQVFPYCLTYVNRCIAGARGAGWLH